MPIMLDEDFDRKLRLPVSNRTEAAAFIANQPAAINLPNYTVQHGYRLLEGKVEAHAEGHQRIICLVTDEAEHQIVYKVRLLIRDEPNAYINRRNATQLLVWRTVDPTHSAVLQGFARGVFLYILATYDIVITDCEQSPDGKRFWMGRIAESIMMDGHHVYYIDLGVLDDDMAPAKTEILTYDSFIEEFEPIGWGNDQSHKDKAFVISVGQL